MLSQPDVDFFEENQQLLAWKLPSVDGRDSTGWFAICRFTYTHMYTVISLVEYIYGIVWLGKEWCVRYDLFVTPP